MPEKFYVTTPIYYVNARPHIGHAYTTIVADVLARRSRAQGTDTWFLTGTDEHGQKIERSAAAAGIPPQQFADEISAQFRTLWDRMGLTYDQYIRTTDEAHKRGVQKLFTTLQQNGHIYLDSYTGAYCVSDESFVDVPTGTPCPDCGRPIESVTEENYFFRLSNFQLPLLNLIESNTLQIEPESRRNEVLSFLRGDISGVFKTIARELNGPNAIEVDVHDALRIGLADGRFASSATEHTYVPGALKDLSISRSSFTWGIPVPGDEKHVIYVWLDALANYMTAVGYGDPSPEAQACFARYWPANLHIVGKEIIRFHCVYWPAFLLAAGLPTPKKIVAHGWLLFDDSKMSKSKGNIVRTETILAAFGTLCPPPPAPATIDNPGAPPFDSPIVKGWGIEPEARPPSLNPPPLSPASLKGMASAVNLPLQQQPILPHASLKGTASAVPQTPPSEPAASAAEVRTPTPGLLSSRSEAEGSASPLGTPTPHDRDLFAADVLRYFLLREIPFGQDGSFSFEALITRYNADLANGYGNLVSRTLGLIFQNFPEGLPRASPPWLCPDRNIFWESGGDPVGAEAWSGTHFIMSEVRRYPESANEDFWPDNKYRLFLAELLLRVTFLDGYISFNKPWVLAKSTDPVDRRKLIEVLYTAAESIRIITALLHPILPHATANVWRQLGLGDIEQAARNGDLRNLQWGGLQPGTRLGPLSPIFPRIEKKDIPRFIQHMADMESPTPFATVTSQQDAATPLQSEFAEAPIASEGAPGSTALPSTLGSIPSFNPAAPPRTSTFAEPDPGLQVAGSSAVTTERPPIPPSPGAPSQTVSSSEVGSTQVGSTAPPDASPQITIEDFAKIELRIAQIVVAERIPKADKLLRLEVDLGYERRQILSGIAEWYTPEDLLGRRIVVITNLAPRKMRGLESHGMLLAASTEGGKPHLATIDSPDLPLGSRLK